MVNGQNFTIDNSPTDLSGRKSICHFILNVAVVTIKYQGNFYIMTNNLFKYFNNYMVQYIAANVIITVYLRDCTINR